MRNFGSILSLCFSLSIVGTAFAQPRVSVGEIKGKGGIMIRGAAVKALQAEHSVSLISKDVVAGTARRLGTSLPKGRKEVSAALGIGAWVEGTLEREQKTLVANLAVVDAASGKTLGVMSYDAPNIKALSKAVRSELFSDLGELIKGGKVPGAKGAEAEVAAAEPATAGESKAAGKRGRAKPEATEPEPAVDGTAATAAAPEEEVPTPEEEPPAFAHSDSSTNEPAAAESRAHVPTPLTLGVGLVGFTRDFVYEHNLSHLSQYDLGFGPSLGINVNWYPGAHFGAGPAANIGLDFRGQLAFGLDSQIGKNNTSFPTSASGFGIGLRGRLPLGTGELGAVFGYGQKSFSIGRLDSTTMAADPSAPRTHPYVPSTSYSFVRIGVDARIPVGEKFSLGASLAYLPTFSSGLETWFPRTSARGIEGDVKLGYAVSSSLDLNASVGLQRFGLSFNPTIGDAQAGRLIAGGAVDQYLLFSLGVGWRFLP